MSPTEQDDLLRARLTEMIDMRHELVKLSVLIDWDIFEREWVGFFPSHTGRPAAPPRLVAGLLYLQHAFALSDGAVVARWSENPYWQHFCGETFFQHGSIRISYALSDAIERNMNAGGAHGPSRLSGLAI